MKKLAKSETDRYICGVCGGIAKYFGIDATIVRLVFAGLCVVGGSGLWLYIIAAFIMPRESQAAGAAAAGEDTAAAEAEDAFDEPAEEAFTAPEEEEAFTAPEAEEAFTAPEEKDDSTGTDETEQTE